MVRDKARPSKKLARSNGNDKVWSGVNIRGLSSGLDLEVEDKTIVQN